MKRHKIKKELPETSKSVYKRDQERDLAYYIHDRVELMHQAFSLLKTKELKLMIPESVKNLSINDLEELCLEELLGISSKRLLAVLDGAEPPSDTDSSSDSNKDLLETISLDSISSDEGDLSPMPAIETSKKSKRRCRRKDRSSGGRTESSKKEDRSRKEKEGGKTDVGRKEGSKTEGGKAARAGVTVLELLELQARARAIRAQLAAEGTIQTRESVTVAESEDDDDVQIKEERPEVVELSSDDEKPDVRRLDSQLAKTSATQHSSIDIRKSSNEAHSNTIVTSKRNDLTIIVPKTQSRKITLNRKKPTFSSEEPKNNKTPKNNTEQNKASTQMSDVAKNKMEFGSINVQNKEKEVTEKRRDKAKKKSKPKSKDKRSRDITQCGSDQDEITLQLSDSEKMDLLEDLDTKNYKNFSSSGTSDSDDSSSDISSDEGSTRKRELKNEGKENIIIKDKTVDLRNDTIVSETDNIEICLDVNSTNENKIIESETDIEVNKPNATAPQETNEIISIESDNNEDLEESNSQAETEVENDDINKYLEKSPEIINKYIDRNESNQVDVIELQGKDTDAKNLNGSEKTSNCPNKDICITNIDDIPLQIEQTDNKSLTHTSDEILPNLHLKNTDLQENDVQTTSNKVELDNAIDLKDDENNGNKGNDHDRSDGEVSDRTSSEVMAFDVEPEIVTLSDEEIGSDEKKKKKKKEKKTRKEKKKKHKNSDLGEISDQNVHKESQLVDLDSCSENCAIIDIDSDDVYEILQISDDSSCYEVEGVSVLSKEPTSDEIEALSAKIEHEIEREEVVTDEQILQHEKNVEIVINMPTEEEAVKNVSWKDRYLGSKKVKKVLKTSNLLNALRKKNIELKKKIEACKQKDAETVTAVEGDKEVEKIEEGTIEHYKTLQGSTKYVDPVKEVIPTDAQTDSEEKLKETPDTCAIDMSLDKQMIKDAKQMLKMFKRLQKYNNMGKNKDPKKPKKKKSKKHKNKDGVPSVATTEKTTQ